MDIIWLGHSCFLIKGKQKHIVNDPFPNGIAKYKSGQLNADIVTISHYHPNHSYVDGISGTPKIVRGPGEYDIANVFIYGISTYHDVVNGEKLGKNTVYLIEMEDMKICHLGDLGHKLTANQVAEIGDVDILMIPVGGVKTISAAIAAETINLLEPKVVIPMHYREQNIDPDLEPLDKFLQEMGIKETNPQPKLTINKSGLTDQTRMIILDYSV